MRRLVAPFLLFLLAAGCTPGEVEEAGRDARERVERAAEDLRGVRADVRDRVAEVRAEAERVREDVARRVRDALEDLRRAVPEAGPRTAPPRASGTRVSAMEAYLTEVLTSVDRYWTRTLRASDIQEPRVRYLWVAPGDRAGSSCGAVADDRAAFYCPVDDTIFVGQTLAAEIYDGVARGFPGQESGQGRAVGDFGVAYVVAHEYGHNLQQEFGYLEAAQGGSAKPFELQADCFAGLWGNAVYREGLIDGADVQEALDTAQAVGDFDLGNEQHHGTPAERRDAWLLGFDSGDPEVCRHFVVS